MTDFSRFSDPSATIPTMPQPPAPTAANPVNSGLLQRANTPASQPSMAQPKPNTWQATVPPASVNPGTSAPARSYVDKYSPPDDLTSYTKPATGPGTVAPMNIQNTQPWQAAPKPVMPPLDVPASRMAPPAPQKTLPQPPDEMLLPPMPAAAPLQKNDAMTASEKRSQSLEDQNIFHLLGIQDAKEEEKESFLDELQQVIWEDFLESDLELLVTEEELVEFRKIENKVGASDEERQSNMIEFLEKLIPDLEKIMLEKALELKAEMFRERIKDMAQTYQQPELATKILQAKALVEDEQWSDAADLLNTIKV